MFCNLKTFGGSSGVVIKRSSSSGVFVVPAGSTVSPRPRVVAVSHGVFRDGSSSFLEPREETVASAGGMIASLLRGPCICHVLPASLR